MWLAMGAAVGLAGLTKGPVVLGVMGTTWLAVWLLGLGLKRGARGTAACGVRVADRGVPRTAAKVLAAAVVAAAVVGPWVHLVRQRSPGWIGQSVSYDVVKRMAQPLEGHKGPPGYHVAAVWPFFLPWSLLLPLGVVLAWKYRYLPQLRFALGAVLGPWVMFELVRTKLPHYMLPTYPWLALLVAEAVVRCLRGQHRDLVATPFLVAVSVVAAIAGLAALGPAAASWWFGESILPGAVVAVVVAAYLAVVVALVTRRRPARGLAVLGLGAMAVWAVAWAVYLPRAQFIRVSVRAADVLRREGAAGPRQVLMLDYKEPSLAFYQGGTIREHPGTQLTREHLDSGARWLVITTNVWNRTPPELRDRFDVIDRMKGLAYAGGRVVEVMIVRPRAAHAAP
jgi:4-amino-4-deoxy-L-arabinose transferase-like glycosyltransferase